MGATLVAVDERSVRDLPGVVKVVVRNNFVGVVAAEAVAGGAGGARAEGHVDAGSALAAPRAISTTTCAVAAQSRDAFVVNSKDVDAHAGRRGDAS